MVEALRKYVSETNRPWMNQIIDAIDPQWSIEGSLDINK
jgi:hypothetical protein